MPSMLSLHAFRRPGTALVFACSALTAASAQVEWRRQPLLGGRYGVATAWDSNRGRAVLFGGVEPADTWEWDGTSWGERTANNAPPGRRSHAMAYDAARGHTLLFGGVGVAGNLQPLGDTWTWDGATWQQRATAATPQARRGHAMAFDTARGRVVLFGGLAGSGLFLADTWEWDGSAWLQRSPPGAPPARALAGMAYDASRGRTVLFGGEDNNVSALNDTWEWDGTTWIQRVAAAAPPTHGAMAFDASRSRTVLCTNGSQCGRASETWEWDGSAWRFRTAGPLARASAALAYDAARAQVVLFGGAGGLNPAEGDTWEWDGTSWSLRLAAQGAPLGNTAFAVFDPVRQRLVAGLRVLDCAQFRPLEIWEWDGSAWTRHGTTTGPVSLASGNRRPDWQAAFDPARARVVVFGGAADAAITGRETWEWDGTQWALRASGVGPSARVGSAVVFDPVRARTLLFGGYEVVTGVPLADLWSWDGTTWSQRSTAVRPSPRLFCASAWDAARGRMVLFGGHGTGAPLAETWEWDGSAWTQRLPSNNPPAQDLARMAFDAARGVCVLTGGGGSSNPVFDVWEWDGVQWTQRQPATATPVASAHLAYDTARRQVLALGGSDRLGTTCNDLWQYGPRVAASYSPYGVGCAGSAGVPTLDAAGALPWLGSPLTLRLTQLPATTAAVVLLGRSDQSFGGVPLPLDLSSAGMTGCSLFASGELVLVPTVIGGAATLPLGVPADASLLGASFFNQGLIADPGANAAGITTSNGGHGVIGGR